MPRHQNTLICRDAKGKIRRVDMSSDWSDDLHAYVIERSSGLLNGKQVIAPPIVIERGKAGRHVYEQNDLQYNSELKKYLDKGYKDINALGITELTEETAENALPTENTDQSGMIKPQLCKVMDKTKTAQINKQWLGSYKLDGVRCLLFMRDGEVHTASRGGQDYDIPATYIREDPYVIQILKENPGMILDGELYRHGWNLQCVSGLCRREELLEDHKELIFNCYDIVDTTLPFKLRARKLGELRDARPNNSRIAFVEHRPVCGLDQIMQMHDEAVANGYEGLVVRDPEKEYKPGARDNRMMKIKEMEEDSFLIIGYELGLRGVEDMCFVLKTNDGKIFKAKPQGNRELKEQYISEIDDIVGRKGDVKYFHFTPDGIPNLPVFLTVRYDI